MFLSTDITSACTKSSDNPNPASCPIADGIFIQDDLVARWDDAQWQKELAALKEVGMHYLIFAPTLHTGENGISQTIYPGEFAQ